MRDMPDQQSALDHLNSVIAARGRGGVFSVALDLGQDSSHVSKWRNRRRPIPPHLINRIMSLSGDLRAGTGPDGPNLPDTGPRGPDGPQNGHKGHHSPHTHPDTGPNGQNDGQNDGPDGPDTGPDGPDTGPDGPDTGPDGPDGPDTGPVAAPRGLEQLEAAVIAARPAETFILDAAPTPATGPNALEVNDWRDQVWLPLHDLLAGIKGPLVGAHIAALARSGHGRTACAATHRTAERLGIAEIAANGHWTADLAIIAIYAASLRSVLSDREQVA